METLENNLREHNEKVDLVENELKVMEFWRENRTFEKSLEQTKGREKYVIYEGPPFATGSMHAGHQVVSTVKDMYGRYKTMSGYDVERRAGWDTHGVPIEMLVNKELNVKTKEDVERIGMKEYHDKCREKVMLCADEWEGGYERLGRWVDCKNDYKTMDIGYMESVWWVFGKLYEKGLIYNGFKVMPYSTGCTTVLSNFEANLDVREVTEKTTTIKFKLVDQKESILVWTSTPWTLLDNMALCVGKNIRMVRMKLKNIETEKEENYVCSEKYYKKMTEKPNKKYKYQVEEIFMSDLLNGKEYVSVDGSICNIFVDGYVKDGDDGYSTAVVHLAPSYGVDDFRVCLEKKLIEKNGEGMKTSVDEEGNFRTKIKELNGKYIKDKKTETELIKYLREKDLVFNEKQYTHKYQYCWRTKTPLINKAVSAWFVDVSKLKDDMLKNIEETNWMPENIKNGRFKNWVQDSCDWCISRTRYWGTPLPIWMSQDGKEVKCVSSVAELTKLTGCDIKDLHRESIDNLTILSNDGSSVLKRIDSVLDCWFESGSMPYGQCHYPFENKDIKIPSDMICEGVDQCRGWFYTLMVLSTALFNKPAYKNVIVTGLVLGEDGKKLSKSDKNYKDPKLVMQKYGADALRLYFLNSPVIKAESFVFDESQITDLTRNTLVPFYHAFKFFYQYLTLFKQKGHSLDFSLHSDNFMDQWILSSTSHFVSQLSSLLDSYHISSIVPLIKSYIDHLTNWYIKFNRDRLKGNSSLIDWQRSLSITYYVINQANTALAPITPFMSEVLYQSLKNISFTTHQSSVHLCNYPLPYHINSTINQNMHNLQSTIITIRKLRSQSNINLRKPISKLYLSHPDPSIISSLNDLKYYIQSETNILDIHTLDFSLIQSSLIYSPKILLPSLKLKLLELNSMPLFSKIVKHLQLLSTPDILSFLSTGSYSLSLDSFSLLVDNSLLQIDISLPSSFSFSSFSPSSSPSPSLVHNLSDNFFVCLDISQSPSLHNLYLLRLLHISIQKTRKQANVNPWDQFLILLSSSNSDFLSFIHDHLSSLSSSVALPLTLSSDLLPSFTSSHTVYDYDLSVSLIPL